MEIDLPLPEGLSLKIGALPPDRKAYATAHLQGGGVLLDGDQSLTEEAVGFGVPVLKRGLQAIFPGAVTLTSRRRGTTWEITARYTLNLVEKISRAGAETVENRLLYAVKYFLAAVIRRSPLLRGALTAASSALRRLFRWETTYAEAGFSAEVSVVSRREEGTGTLVVTVEAAGLPADVTEVVVMNEQGAHFFDRYCDSSGARLEGKAIGCWDEVTAGEAWFESRARRVAFRLGRAEGARLFRGRELVGSRLAWAGFGYTFPPSLQRLRYELKIERLA
jgi:hypothetical protein